jgi:hypothetical protein
MAAAAGCFRVSLLGADTTFLRSPVERGLISLVSAPSARSTILVRKVIHPSASRHLDPAGWNSWDAAIGDFADCPAPVLSIKLTSSVVVGARTDGPPRTIRFLMALTYAGWRIYRVEWAD